jgi:hypothetical protein
MLIIKHGFLAWQPQDFICSFSYILINVNLQESEILEQIDRDVKRTHPEMPFFSAKANQESLRRVLIIFSKLNPTIRYVQGMNEVLAPLFYVFKNDPDTSNSVCSFTI